MDTNKVTGSDPVQFRLFWLRAVVVLPGLVNRNLGKTSTQQKLDPHPDFYLRQFVFACYNPGETGRVGL